jgi:hypothetical protein
MVVKRTAFALLSSLAFLVSGCGTMPGTTGGIMMAETGDPVGSANIGTGSVTVGSVMPEEAKSAGIGIGP